MVKKYHSTRYTKKKRLKYFLVGLILVFIVLVTVSAYRDYPQLEPVRMQMESFKSEIGTSGLSVGETGMCDGLAITLVSRQLSFYANI